MRPEFDSEIDSVLRGHARRGGAPTGAWAGLPRPSLSDESSTGSHLDADEIAAFGEGALPAAARARYSAHLADCDDCRRSVAQVALAAGVADRIEERERGVAGAAAGLVAASEPPTWRERLAAVFAPRAWRYAMPVVALVAISAVVLVVTRRLPREGALEVASNRGSAGRPVAAPTAAAPEAHHAEVSPQQDAQAANTAATDLSKTGGGEDATAAPEIAAKTQPKSVDGNAPSSLGASVGSAAAPAGVSEAVRIESAPVTQTYSTATPSPLPPAPASAPLLRDAAAATPAPKPAPAEADMDERARRDSRAATVPRDEAPTTKRHGPQRSLGGSTDGLSSSAADAAKEERAQRSRTRGPRQQQQQPRAAAGARGEDEEAKAGSGAAREQQTETRAVGGRRFRREGNVWIDTAYRAGQATVVIRRDSEQYRALVADEPEIGRIQRALGGEAVIVWKGRAYRVKP